MPQQKPSSQSTPKLSIVIPTYNRAEILRECLTNIREVTVDCEVVVIDNASPDATAAVVAECAKIDPRIRYERNTTNIGIVKNFQRAFAEARGEYVSMTGDDDLFLPGCFEKKLPILDANPEIGLVYSLIQPMDGQGRMSAATRGTGTLEYSYIGGRNEFTTCLEHHYIALNGTVFRRSNIEKYGGPDDNPSVSPANDWEMCIRQCRYAQTAFINEPLACVRIHAESHSMIYIQNEAYLKARLGIWKKLLVDTDDLPILNDDVWDRMFSYLRMDIANWHRGDAALMERYMMAAYELKNQHLRKVKARFERLNALAQQDKVQQNEAQQDNQPRTTAVVREAVPPRSIVTAADGTDAAENRFTPKVRPMTVPGARGFNFLSVFEWNICSGWDALVKAFVEEFAPEEDMALILKTRPTANVPVQQIEEELIHYLTQTLGRDPENIPDLILMNECLPEVGMPALYTAANCYVFPARSGSSGRTCLEASAAGLAVIAAGWGGQSAQPSSGGIPAIEYIEYTSEAVPETVFRSNPELRGQKWAQPSIVHLRQLMRKAFAEHISSVRETAQAA